MPPNLMSLHDLVTSMPPNRINSYDLVTYVWSEHAPAPPPPPAGRSNACGDVRTPGCSYGKGFDTEAPCTWVFYTCFCLANRRSPISYPWPYFRVCVSVEMFLSTENGNEVVLELVYGADFMCVLHPFSRRDLGAKFGREMAQNRNYNLDFSFLI